jgi:hypothetical protein
MVWLNKQNKKEVRWLVEKWDVPEKEAVRMVKHRKGMLKTPYFMLRHVDMQYEITADDVGKQYVFRTGYLWWKKYWPIYLRQEYVGLTGKELFIRGAQYK